MGLALFNPSLLWLIPALVALLVFLRFYRSRRREVVAGSLLIWRRLAAAQPKTPPRRVVVDRSLLLQCAAVALLVLALAAPSVALGGAGARVLVLVVDNGPLSRARSADGVQLWLRVRDRAESILRGLNSDDRVLLARAAPVPVSSKTPLTAAAALRELEKLQPALSGPGPEDLWIFAADAARSAGGDAARSAMAIVSLQPPPGNAEERWLCVAPENLALENAGVVDFGAVDVAGKDGVAVQVLTRVKNFSQAEQSGSVELLVAGRPSQSQPLALPPNGDGTAVFSLPAKSGDAILLQWKAASGKTDAFPEDDAVVAVPRKRGVLRARFHGAVPALEELYRSMGSGEKIVPGDAQPVDLEVYVHSVPIASAIPSTSRALLLIAPESDFAGIFSVGAQTLENPQPQRDEDDPLTRGIGDRPESTFVARKALEILRTGDFKTLIKDAKTGRALAATFRDERARPGFLLAFVPTDLTKPAQAPLTALLARMLLSAAGSGDPYTTTRAAQLEQQNGAALGADWQKTAEGGAGVLDERVSALHAGRPSSTEAAARAGVFQQEENRVELAPLLALLALVLIALELWLERPSRASSLTPVSSPKG